MKPEVDSDDDSGQSIINICATLTVLQKSGINRRGIVALVHDDTQIPKETIQTVLTSLKDLKQKFTVR